ncbi:MAG: hypothetical protein WCK31_04710 [bacterium]
MSLKINFLIESIFEGNIFPILPGTIVKPRNIIEKNALTVVKVLVSLVRKNSPKHNRIVNKEGIIQNGNLNFIITSAKFN